MTLINDVEGQRSTNIGVCLIPKELLTFGKAKELKDIIKNEVLACPPNFLICTKQG